MNMNSLGYQAYKKTQVQTADQGRLVLMCYDGTINFLRRAQKAHAEKNFVSRNELLTKAQNVLWELINGLNFQAGEIAYNLDSLYNYMIRRILDSQYTDNVEPVNEVITHLQELEESWKTIILKQS
ncbi:MAG TPA: flagellar export chaperone FliS [Deltaproteobacteria bacterium]|nr:flagellar export chaperone FliS [Deltaproteobacteria bacterium]